MTSSHLGPVRKSGKGVSIHPREHTATGEEGGKSRLFFQMYHWQSLFWQCFVEVAGQVTGMTL